MKVDLCYSCYMTFKTGHSLIDNFKVLPSIFAVYSITELQTYNNTSGKIRLSVLHLYLNCVIVTVETGWATMLIYCRYRLVIAHMNLTFEGDGSTGWFITGFKPRRKHLYHLFYTDNAPHVLRAVNECLPYHSNTKQRLFAERH
jgi:hypothetical protein